MEYSNPQTDGVKLREILSHWIKATSLIEVAAEHLEKAVFSLAHAACDTTTSGDQPISFSFEPFTRCLRVVVVFAGKTSSLGAGFLSPDNLPEAVNNVDKVIWREQNNQAFLEMTQFVRDEKRPHELYFLNLRPGLDKKAAFPSKLMAQDFCLWLHLIPRLGFAP